ncbi:MAG: hypothetical protein ABIS86_05340 [Streptosporangiaceae bacterium]
MKRRENGLSADAYAPLIDLIPQLADELLSVLRQAGIAAYALLEEPTEDPEALDRVYVDVAHQREAEDLLHDNVLRDRISATETLPSPPELDEDAIFAQIVAGYGDTPSDVSWPDAEDVLPEEGDVQDRTGTLPTARVVFSGDPRKRSEEPEDFPEPDEDNGYTPPPPEPIPLGDPVTRMAWAALVGGPVYILATVLFDWEAPGWAAFLAVAAFIGGFVALVLRMGDDPRDDGDDGAVI